MKNFVNFLSKSVIEEVKAPVRTGGGPAKKARFSTSTFPEIRVWKDGSVYPNQAAVDQFDLEFRTSVPTKVQVKSALEVAAEAAGDAAEIISRGKPVVTHAFPEGTGNGFDVIDSRNWAGFKGGEDGAMLFISPVAKNEKKVDLFANVNRDPETGIPTSTVAEQGLTTYGKSVLLTLLKEVYGVELGEDKEYVDVAILDKLGDYDVVGNLTKKIAQFPKSVARGDKAGEQTYVRRENAKVYAFIPSDLEA